MNTDPAHLTAIATPATPPASTTATPIPKAAAGSITGPYTTIFP
ncbi:hypothetical protein [Puia dinghuensis]|nr:hypothetical protein [Puia dinghuensis]